ncbi:MAG: hypothetical protein KIS66_08755 [Fimbriimonadaceae bacterium]|nr:hypothetical protein [Fimbriimonadaceae bacterium]
METKRSAKRPPLQFWGVRVTIAFFVLLVLACGGGQSSSEGGGYPTTRHVTLVAYNEGTYAVKFKIGPDATAFGPSVAASSHGEQTSPDTYTWDTAAHHQNLRVAVGDTYEYSHSLISMTGEQASQGMRIRAVWNGETLTLSLISP